MAEFIYKNIVPGQMQIGNIVMGRGTNIIIENWDVKPDDMNNQDYQISRADEMRFGWDSFKPTTIEIDLQVLNNRMLPGYEHLLPNFWKEYPTLGDLKREWRFDEGRQIWGQMKPLYICSKLDGIPKIVFGRPGQFGITAQDEYAGGEVVKCVTQFRRGDTLAYGINENLLLLTESTLEGVIDQQTGNGLSWMRIEIGGPITHPILTLTNLFNPQTGQPQTVTVDLDYSIAPDEVVEISSYPWARRAVNNADPPIVLSALLGGVSPYLDRLRFDFDSVVGISLTGSDMNSETECAVLWRDSYTVI